MTSKAILIKAKLVKETPAARLMDCEGDEFWFPKSQTNYLPTSEKLEVPCWLLDKMGLEYGQ